MKKILIVFVALLGVLLLTSCTKATYKFEITEISTYRNTATISYSFSDEESQLITSEIKYVISSKEENADISKTGVIDKNDDTLKITGLVADTEYVITITTAFDGKEEVLVQDKSFKTINVGTSEENPFIINTNDDFKNAFASDTEGYYKLGADLDLEGYNLTPVYTSKTFLGTFDGNGKTISNFTLGSESSRYSNSNYIALFGRLGETGVIKNLNISNATIYASRSSTSYFGILVAYNTGNISNVKISDSKINISSTSSYAQNVGGLVGYNDGTGVIENCELSNVKVEAAIQNELNLGGFVGKNTANMDATSTRINKISNCKVSNVSIEVTHTATHAISNINVKVGGFIGMNNATVENCSVSGLINAHKDLTKNNTIVAMIGGFAGQNFVNGSSKIIGATSSVSLNVVFNNSKVGLLVGQNGNDYPTSSALISNSKAVVAEGQTFALSGQEYQLGVVGLDKKAGDKGYTLEGELSGLINVYNEENKLVRLDTVKINVSGFEVTASEEVVEEEPVEEGQQEE